MALDFTSTATTEWFTIARCYELSTIYKMPEEKHKLQRHELKVIAVGRYGVFFKGVSPLSWPSNLGTLYWYTMYTYAINEDKELLFKSPTVKLIPH